MESTINAKGEITNPKKLRDQLGLKPRARVKLFPNASGDIVILPLRPITALRGILRTDRHASQFLNR